MQKYSVEVPSWLSTWILQELFPVCYGMFSCVKTAPAAVPDMSYCPVHHFHLLVKGPMNGFLFVTDEGFVWEFCI